MDVLLKKASEQMTISKCKLIDLSTYSDQRGALTCIEGALDIPFEIKRVYYFYGSQIHHRRGMHAHKILKQVLIPIAGSFDVVLDDGDKKRRFKMDNPTKGILIDGVIWREITNFSDNSICLVLASQHFDQSEYIDDYTSFKKLVEKKTNFFSYSE